MQDHCGFVKHSVIEALTRDDKLRGGWQLLCIYENSEDDFVHMIWKNSDGGIKKNTSISHMKLISFKM